MKTKIQMVCSTATCNRLSKATCAGNRSNLKKYYTILEIPEDASPEQIKAAFRKKAKETHPDRGGDAATFIDVKEAYDVLSDPEQRARYDRGEEPNREETHESTVTSWEDFVRQYPFAADVRAPADPFLDGELPTVALGAIHHRGMLLSSRADVREAKNILLGEKIDYQLHNWSRMTREERWSLPHLRKAIETFRTEVGLLDHEYQELMDRFHEIEAMDQAEREIDADQEWSDMQEDQFDLPETNTKARFLSDKSQGVYEPYGTKHKPGRRFDRGRKAGERGHRRGDDHNPGGNERRMVNRFRRK